MIVVSLEMFLANILGKSAIYFNNWACPDGLVVQGIATDFVWSLTTFLGFKQRQGMRESCQWLWRGGGGGGGGGQGSTGT